MKDQMIQAAAQNPEIVRGIGITVLSFTLAQWHTIAGLILALIGICYTVRKWYLMEKHKKDQTNHPFKKKK